MLAQIRPISAMFGEAENGGRSKQKYKSQKQKGKTTNENATHLSRH